MSYVTKICIVCFSFDLLECKNAKLLHRKFFFFLFESPTLLTLCSLHIWIETVDEETDIIENFGIFYFSCRMIPLIFKS